MRQLYDLHVASVIRALTLLGVPGNDLEDARQEVFMVVCRKLPDYEERGNMRSWLYSICLRVAQHRRRARLRRREFNLDFPEQAVDPTQDQRIMEREALVLGCKLLNELTHEQRAVFLLYELEDLSMSQVARLLNVPLQTAYSRLRKARSRLFEAAARADADA